MKYRSRVCFLFMALGLLTSTGFAQLGLGKLQYGFGAGVFRGATNFPNDNVKPLFRVALRYPIHELFMLEGTGEIGTIGNSSYETSILPLADLRILFSPDWKQTISPYLFAGIGLLQTEVTTSPTVAPRETVLFPSKYNGWDIHVPLGAGVQYRVSENFAINGNAGYHYVNQKRLEQAQGKNNDGIWDVNVVLMFGGDDGSGDPDNDGLIDNIESELGTDPRKPDTDGDDITDGEEVNVYKTSPLRADSDGDKLSDKAEISDRKTDPLKADTDGDGLNDGDETSTYMSNPLKDDSDGDGLKDNDEVLKYMTNPLNTDSDSDGLSDNDEVLKYRTNPLSTDSDADLLADNDEVLKYLTDPLKPDSDGDGLSDGDEVTTHLTNPLNADSDNDGLTDADEVIKLKTNPKLVDSDYDSILDGTEVKNGSDPMDPASPGKPAAPKTEGLKTEVGKGLVLEGVVFKSGRAEITAGSDEVLQKVLKTFIDNFELEVEIRGYTDNVGKPSTNQKLSRDRAEAVKRWLVAKGIDPRRITTRGFGQEEPIWDNSTAEGRAKNRRIEFYRTK